MSFVYLTQFYNEPDLIKIGYSKDPETRLKFLKSQYGPILHSYFIEDPVADLLERELHKYFKDLRNPVDKLDYWYANGRSGFTEFFKIDQFIQIASREHLSLELQENEYYKYFFKSKKNSHYFKGEGLRKIK